MEYAKHLLNKEKIKLSKYETMSKLFEMLSNQQEIKNVGKEAMSLIQKLKGNVALFQYTKEQFHLIHFYGSREFVEEKVNNRAFTKKIRDARKPLFGKPENGYYMILPIYSKDDYLGALCIFEEQEIKVWEEIYTLLHMMTLVFKYYDLVEENKLNSVKDNVTDLFNYRHFQDQLELELEKATRYHANVSMVTVDVENFRLFNDHLGYDAGDEVLKQLSKIISRTCRKIDMPARLNADTFTILLTNTDLVGAYYLMNRILMALKRHVFKIKGKELGVRVKTSATQYEIHDVHGLEFLSQSTENLRIWTTDEVMKKISELEGK